jgi:hypothetical protein
MGHQEKQDAAGERNSQPDHIDRGIQLILKQVANGCEEIAAIHIGSVLFS